MYYYIVTAVNLNGESSHSNEVAGSSGVPTAPTNLVATPGNQQVNLTWTASTTLGIEGNSSGYYQIYQSITAIGGYEPVGKALGINYQDLYLTNGTQYYYIVQAVNVVGFSQNSNVVSAMPVGPPLAPTGLSATAGNGQVALSWTASSTAASYTVARSTSSNGTYTSLAAGTGIASTTFTDSTAVNGTTYYYEVEAINAGGNSPFSAYASATPFLPTYTVTGSVGTGSGAVMWQSGPSIGPSSVPAGSVVIFRATPTGSTTIGSIFSSWSGVTCTDATGQVGTTCTVLINSNTNAVANFIPTYSLFYSASGSGTGTITCASGGSPCPSYIRAGTSVTFTATPAAGSSFSSWQEACAGVGSTTSPYICQITINGITGVIASFMPIVPTILSDSPNGTQPFATALPITVTTNENMTCKYQGPTGAPGPPSSAPSYASMNTFVQTGGTVSTQWISAIPAIAHEVYYYIMCQDQADNFTTSNYALGFNVASPVATAPVLTVNGVGTQNVLSWTASPPVGGVPVLYEVYRVLQLKGQDVGSLSQFPPSTPLTTWTDPNARPGITYRYAVVAYVPTGTPPPLTNPTNGVSNSVTAITP